MRAEDFDERLRTERWVTPDDVAAVRAKARRGVGYVGRGVWWTVRAAVYTVIFIIGLWWALAAAALAWRFVTGGRGF